MSAVFLEPIKRRCGTCGAEHLNLDSEHPVFVESALAYRVLSSEDVVIGPNKKSQIKTGYFWRTPKSIWFDVKDAFRNQNIMAVGVTPDPLFGLLVDVVNLSPDPVNINKGDRAAFVRVIPVSQLPVTP